MPTTMTGRSRAIGCLWQDVFTHITSRWGVLILMALIIEPLRFYRLRDIVDGISEKMLSQTLKSLQRDGFIMRDQDTSVPPKVTYSLTPLGVDLAERMFQVSEWIGDHIDEIVSARAAYDRPTKCNL